MGNFSFRPKLSVKSKTLKSNKFLKHIELWLMLIENFRQLEIKPDFEIFILDKSGICPIMKKMSRRFL